MAKFLTVSYEQNTIIYALGNGERIVADLDTLSPEMAFEAKRHGMNQKIRDSASSFSKTNDFKGAKAAMQATYDSIYVDRQWNRNGSGMDADIVAAVANLKKLSSERAQAIIDSLDDEQMKVLRAQPTVKAEMLRIKSERAKQLAKAEKAADIFADLGLDATGAKVPVKADKKSA